MAGRLKLGVGPCVRHSAASSTHRARQTSTALPIRLLGQNREAHSPDDLCRETVSSRETDIGSLGRQRGAVPVLLSSTEGECVVSAVASSRRRACCLRWTSPRSKTQCHRARPFGCSDSPAAELSGKVVPPNCSTWNQVSKGLAGGASRRYRLSGADPLGPVGFAAPASRPPRVSPEAPA
jgi:hypothetical protein